MHSKKLAFLQKKITAGGVDKAFLRNSLIEVGDILTQAFNAKVAVCKLLKLRSHFTDTLILELWKQIFSGKLGFCLIAAGGYGREELFPYSDVDLLLLHDGKLLKTNQQKISQFISSLWDIGLTVGHSLRTITQTLELARNDIGTYTNLLEMRYLGGDYALYRQLKDALTNKPLWTYQSFLLGKLEEQSNRHKRFNETAHLLEPDVKQSPGTLRDLHLLKWLCIQYFSTNNLTVLVEKNIISESDLETLNSSTQYLLGLRFALHLLNKKDNNRLFFDKQIELSKQEYSANNMTTQRVESFMKRYHVNCQEVRAINEIILQYFLELSQGYHQEKIKLCDDFYFQNSVICLFDVTIIPHKPWLILQAFLLLSTHDKATGFGFRTLTALRKYKYLVNDDFRSKPNNQQTFLKIFSEGNNIPLTLKLMARHGILGRYLPEYQYVVGQTQHDLFHLYTVDQHTLFVIKKIDELKKNDSFYKKLFNQLPKTHLLYLAAFYHDIGKGHGTDHSQYGAQVVSNFALKHGFFKHDQLLLSWLVNHHLLMSHTAQKQDLSDPEIIEQFANKVNNVERLNYLFLLTIADIQATNDSLWNSWREALLKKLYQATLSCIQSKFYITQESDVLKLRQELITSMLEKEHYTAQKLMSLWNEIGIKYILKEEPVVVAWQTKALLNYQFDALNPLILLRNDSNQGATQVFICSKDRHNLFAMMVATLTKLNLNILEAKIFTSLNGFSLDTYYVMDLNNKIINDENRLTQIKNRLSKALKQKSFKPQKPSRRMSRQLAHFCHESKVTINMKNFSNRIWTKLVIKATDRPGLLGQLGYVFAKQNISVHKAKIVTLGDQVEDIFFISTKENKPLKNRAKLIQLRKAIKKEITP